MVESHLKKVSKYIPTSQIQPDSPTDHLIKDIPIVHDPTSELAALDFFHLLITHCRKLEFCDGLDGLGGSADMFFGRVFCVGYIGKYLGLHLGNFGFCLVLMMMRF